MRIIYDPLADAVSITLTKGKVAKTKEIGQDTLLDLDKKGNPLYLEILDASRHFRKNKKEPFQALISLYEALLLP